MPRPRTGPRPCRPTRTDYSHAINALLPKATVKDLADSIDYAVKRIGIDHVGLSSDFNHGGGVVGWANEGEAAGVTAELLRRGYSARPTSTSCGAATICASYARSRRRPNGWTRNGERDRTSVFI
jgi:microsomal dipeptidase-like Zn-dependent dipeptidase